MKEAGFKAELNNKDNYTFKKIKWKTNLKK
jgi:hypothetical protein